MRRVEERSLICPRIVEIGLIAPFAFGRPTVPNYGKYRKPRSPQCDSPSSCLTTVYDTWGDRTTAVAAPTGSVIEAGMKIVESTVAFVQAPEVRTVFLSDTYTGFHRRHCLRRRLGLARGSVGRRRPAVVRLDLAVARELHA